jgi:hypothetical protein
MNQNLGLQFHYTPPGMHSSHHEVVAHSGGEFVGSMRWNSRAVQGINVNQQNRRQGIATAIWHEGHRLAEENARVPRPKHSGDRTIEGDAWARSVGGSLPRRKRG